MKKRQVVLIVLGFLVTLSSMALSVVFIKNAETERADLLDSVGQLEEARSAARASVVESNRQIYSASVLFTLARSDQTANVTSHLVDFSRRATVDAFEFKCGAVDMLLGAIRQQGTMEAPSPAPVPLACADFVGSGLRMEEPANGQACPEDHGALVAAFLEKPYGDAAIYRELACRERLLDARFNALDGVAAIAVRDTQRALVGVERDMSLLQAIGTALALLGLMIVMVRDLFG